MGVQIQAGKGLSGLEQNHDWEEEVGRRRSKGQGFRTGFLSGRVTKAQSKKLR